MATRGKKKEVPLESLVRGLSKGSTYRLNPGVALELEIYSKVGMHGAKKEIIEEALGDWFKKNRIPPELREAAKVLLAGVLR